MQINKNKPVLVWAGAAYKDRGLKLLLMFVLILHNLFLLVGSCFACADDWCFPSKFNCHSQALSLHDSVVEEWHDSVVADPGIGSLLKAIIC